MPSMLPCVARQRASRSTATAPVAPPGGRRHRRSLPHACLLALSLMLFCISGQAALVPAELRIEASVGFDPALLLAPETGSTQTGTWSLTAGGARTEAQIDGDLITGSNPLTGALTSTGDGIAANLVAQGTGASTAADLFFDALLVLTNDGHSALWVSLAATIALLVEANGDEAVATAALRVLDGDDLPLIAEQTITASTLDLQDDTLDATLPFSLTLLPGAQAWVRMQLDAFGQTGFFNATGSSDDYRAQAALDLRILAAAALPVPAPAPVLLLLGGWALIVRSLPRRRSQRRAGS